MAKGLDQQKVADALGLKKSIISRYETGSRSIRCDRLFAICELFGITIEEFFRGPNRPLEPLRDEVHRLVAAADYDDLGRIRGYIEALLEGGDAKKGLRREVGRGDIYR